MEPFLFILLVAPIVGLAVDVALQATLCRLAVNDAHMRIQFAAFGAGLATVAVFLVVLLSRAPLARTDKIGYFLLHLLTYACFGFIFFNMVNANVSSLRVRMLKEYLASDPVPLTDLELYAKYPVADMVSARLARLEAGGQIIGRGGRYYLQGKAVAMISALFAGLRSLLLGNRAP